MHVLKVRNVHEALPAGLYLLDKIGVRRESRNGPVMYGGSVTTIYERPWERVIFWPERDANPFFHLYEALWMLAGRNDVAPLERYVKNSVNYSDDGVTLHGAYGHRWRHHFNYKDQLRTIATRLKEDPTDRRCVLQMWDAEEDLLTNEEVKNTRPKVGKDFPCNTIATFQRGVEGELNLTVFCRSNDIIWGAYGANAVQFSFLLEYMAHWIGCPIGTYSQISVNWHGYIDTLDKVKDIRPDKLGWHYNPYLSRALALTIPEMTHSELDYQIEVLLDAADSGFTKGLQTESMDFLPSTWSKMIYDVLKAHHIYKTNVGISRYNLPLQSLGAWEPVDWVVAAREWLERRRDKWIVNGNPV